MKRVPTKTAPCSHAELLAVLSYDPDTGVFIWKTQRVGFVAGAAQRTGYVLIGLKYKLYSAHRLAWFYMTGEWPTKDNDHKNRQRCDNRFINLRQADNCENQANRSRSARNKCGFKGVHAAAGKFRASVWDKTRNIHLGYYTTPEAAHAAYVAKATELFGQFACEG